jgi:protein tyrosine/serine phosphatase
MPRRPALPAPDLNTKEGQARAWRELYLGDHGFLRLRFRNAHQVSEKIWRSNQPSPPQLEDWAKAGIKTVVNLRGDNPKGYTILEKEACARLGMALIFLPTESRGAPKLDRLLKAKEAFETMAYPALLHCKSGADRAGFMTVFFQHVMQGQALAEAQDHLSLKYLHIKAGKTGILDAFWDQWAIAHAEGAEFWDWLANTYDEAALNRSFKPDSFGSFIVDAVLRRE